MADSVREQILGAIVTELSGMSVANGFENDFPGGVHRFQRAGAALANPPTIVVTLIQDQKDNASETLVSGRLEVAVEVFAVDAGDLGESTGAYIDSLAQDVEKAIGADSTLGGLASFAFVDHIRPFGLIDGVPFVGVACRVVVQYRHLRGAPESAA